MNLENQNDTTLRRRKSGVRIPSAAPDLKVPREVLQRRKGKINEAVAPRVTPRNIMPWHHQDELGISYRFRCGHCGADTGNNKGFRFVGGPSWDIVICPVCVKPLFVDQGVTIPAGKPGDAISHLPTDVNALYEEARSCIQANAPNGAALICRKLLMHIAVEQGAKENLSFQAYVNYIVEQHLAPPNSKAWVDHIRERGNAVTHDLQPFTPDDSKKLLHFTALLLRTVYEAGAMLSLGSGEAHPNAPHSPNQT